MPERDEEKMTDMQWKARRLIKLRQSASFRDAEQRWRELAEFRSIRNRTDWLTELFSIWRQYEPGESEGEEVIIKEEAKKGRGRFWNHNGD